MVAQSRLLENRWDDARAATMDEPGKLLYRSNLLGSDKRITNYGGETLPPRWRKPIR